MDNKPFFSVCIPVYNAEKYLREAIESVLVQEYNDYEIILADDGSRDSSAAICDEYAEKYSFIHVLHKNNEGPLLARHDAVKMSKGKYLMFLDSDDVFESNALSKMYSLINEKCVDTVVFGGYRFGGNRGISLIHEDMGSNTVFEGNTRTEFFNIFIKNRSLSSMWCKCIKREVYDVDADYSCYKGMIQSEDRLISLYCLDRAEKILYVKDAIYGYRVNPQGTSYNFTLKNYKDSEITQRFLSEFIEKHALGDTAVMHMRKHRLNMAYNCAKALAYRVEIGRSEISELEEAIKYIADDSDFVKAYSEVSGEVPFYERKTARLIINRKATPIIRFSRNVRRLIKIKKLLLRR